MQLSLFKGNQILTCILPEKQQGQYWVMHRQEKGYEEKLLGIEGINDQWMLRSNKKACLLDEENQRVKEVPLKPMEVYRIFLTDTNESALLFTEPITEDRKTFRKVLLPIEGSIMLGRSDECDIQYSSQYVSGRHAKLTVQQGDVYIENLSQSNGTYVNGLKIDKKKLNPGDNVFIIGMRFIVGNGFIALNNPDGHVRYSKAILREYTKQESMPKVDEFEDISEEEITTFHTFYRPPRVIEKVESVTIKIDEPPATERREQTPLMLMIGPSITMGLASLVTGIFTFQYALSTNGNLRFAIPTLIMSICMLIGTILFPILNRKYEKKKQIAREKHRKEKYGQYLKEIETDIHRLREKQTSILYQNHLNVEDYIERIKQRHSSLWERLREHEDFLLLRLGIGEAPFEADIKSPEKRFKLDDDHLQEQMLAIANQPKVLTDVPVTMNFAKDHITGIVGDHKFLSGFTKNLLFQTVALHSYEELKIVFLYDKKENDLWNFVKWLPHVWGDDEEVRFIATTNQEVKELSNYLDKEISRREAMQEKDLAEITPHFLVIACDSRLALKAKFIEKILSNKNQVGFSLIQLDEDYVNLPKECSAVIRQTKEHAEVIRRNEASKQQRFKPEIYTDGLELSISQSLANTRLVSSENSFILPERLTFLEMFEVGKVEHLNAITRWQQNDPTSHLEARIGIGTDGEWFSLDLHEKFHGPHGLIAGMTGSGKSEFIMTYILSLAVNYHPNEVGFILIDYKGGGMAHTFTNLPHVAGTITNLDGAAVNRSLISIQSELRRRQAIFSEVSRQMEISNIDIYKYQKLYREGKVREPLQHLFIISDEFAELKTQQPEFMEQLVSAARIGRSLGIHLILATQKPSGVVDDQIWSNSKFRISLKVQERADSMDIIKRPDAAELSVTGRFYLQVGYNELFELGQSAWGGAPYYPSDKVENGQEESISIINNLGKIITEVRDDSRKQQTPNAPKQIDEITKYLARIAEEEKISVRPIWLDPIPSLIYVDELYKKYKPVKQVNVINPIIGELDDPMNQRQSALHFPLTREGNAIIYGTAGSGKTTFLTTLLYSMMEQHSPQEVNFYILDFGSETLRPFVHAPHVGDVVISDEEEKVHNLFKQLSEKLYERKKLFANYGGDLASYVSATGNQIPSIVVMVHNYSAFSEVYYELEEALGNLSREGMKYGIYFILTCMNASSVRYRIAQNFKQQYVLQLNDQTDYSSILGSVHGVYPSKHKGRGIIKDTNVYEFQTAHAFAEITFEAIKQYSATVTARYPKQRAKRIAMLPEVVDMNYFVEQGEEFQGHVIPIGVDKQSLEVMRYNFAKQSVHTVFQKKEVNASFSQYVAEALARNSDKQIIVIDALQAFDTNRTMPYRYINSQFDATIAEMFHTLVQRNNRYKEALEEGIDVPQYENITYVIHSLSTLMGIITEKSLKNFNELIAHAEKAYNVTFIICDSVDEAIKYSSRPWFKSHASEEDGIWLGNGIANQFTLKVNNMTSQLREEIGDSFGYVVEQGKPLLMKIATLGEQANDLEVR